MKTPFSRIYPPTHILNPLFHYVDAEHTDVSETFRRARGEHENTSHNQDQVDSAAGLVQVLPEGVPVRQD